MRGLWTRQGAPQTGPGIVQPTSPVQGPWGPPGHLLPALAVRALRIGPIHGGDLEPPCGPGGQQWGWLPRLPPSRAVHPRWSPGLAPRCKLGLWVSLLCTCLGLQVNNLGRPWATGHSQCLPGIPISLGTGLRGLGGPDRLLCLVPLGESHRPTAGPSEPQSVAERMSPIRAGPQNCLPRQHIT